MSSAKKGKKTPDMKGQHTLFSAIANAKKNESAYKLFSVHPTPKEIECDSHDSQALYNAFEDYIRELIALLEHRAAVQIRRTAARKRLEHSERLRKEVQVAAGPLSPAQGLPDADHEQSVCDQERSRELTLQAGVRQAGQDYLRVIRNLAAAGRAPPKCALGNVFRLVVGRLERHGVVELAQEGTALMDEVCALFPPSSVRNFENAGGAGGGGGPSLFLGLHPEGWNHLDDFENDQAEKDKSKRTRAPAELSAVARAAYNEIEVKRRSGFELLGQGVTALHSAALQLKGDPDPEGAAADPAPLQDLATLLNLRTALDIMERDLAARLAVIQRAGRKAATEGLLANSVVYRALTVAPSARGLSFDSLLKTLLKALGVLGRLEGAAHGDEEAAEGGDAATPNAARSEGDEEMRRAGREGTPSRADSDVIVTSDAEVEDQMDNADEEKGAASTGQRKRTRQQADREAREAAEAAEAVIPKEQARLAAEQAELAAAFPPASLYDLASRLLGLMLQCFSAAEAQGMYGGPAASKTRGSGAGRNLRVILDKTIAESLTSKGLPQTWAKAGILRAVRDPVEIVRVVANAVAWRMAYRTSDAREFPSLHATMHAFMSDGHGQEGVRADLTEALRFVEEDSEKMLKIFGTGGLRVLLMHTAQAVVAQNSEPLTRAFQAACAAALGERHEDHVGAVARTRMELEVVSKVVV